jgi:ParB-like chromosome segregation protein Spo0J
MKVESVFIADIKVENRRREDFGDLEGLAASIGKYGLLQPPVVDFDGSVYRLVAGERRLRACRDILKWTEIPVRLYSELTEDERREIELEENLQRKDLTPYELSRAIVSEAMKVAPLISTKVVEIEKPKKAGRKSTYEAPKKDVAQAIGESTSNLVRAEQHVAAVTKYPELAVVAPTQKDAITVAKNLDKLKEGERSEARSRLMKHDQPTLADLAEKPPYSNKKMVMAKPYRSQWREWVAEIRERLPSLMKHCGPRELSKQWTNEEWEIYLKDLRGFREDLDRVINEMEEVENELRQQAG